MDVLEIMERTGMVPVFYNADAETAKNAVRACYEGGVRAFEFTNRGAAAYDVFCELAAMVAADCPGMVLGIGSIVNAGDCRKFIGAGARFIVSPILAEEVLRTAEAEGIPCIPGCATPTEIYNGQRMGAEMVKVFPAAEVGGPRFVKAVLAPMPWSRIMVTGGVEPTRDNLAGWFGAGVKCVGIGSNLFPPEALEEGCWDEVTSLCRFAIGTIASLRQ